MNTKLTLSIESQIIQEAKVVAKKHGKSLSKLIEHYLMTLTAPATEKNDENSALLKLKGSFNDPKMSDEKSLLNALNNKYMGQ